MGCLGLAPRLAPGPSWERSWTKRTLGGVRGGSWLVQASGQGLGCRDESWLQAWVTLEGNDVVWKEGEGLEGRGKGHERQQRYKGKGEKGVGYR